ncbi:flagellar biosynthesis repressor FlbT [Cohaesibacter celericrescens]|uniref:Flagellar biosynthesis repressor FlbT n=1 Tax=Cohaesibacter celericrescens TaxID=2067669 RepID=A0A2N5XXM7_9HYPH|nr:flagellar biosynthesis repressor FlbT [Cohaesibacter celericrescens]PLW75565.1 flagellar biosynthesis repressor FlbT [Cohaesibacter celericrescens]PLW79250.1 flagellar biosynthesis repressor FlbT [Cohaesibacter celericrescens]
MSLKIELRPAERIIIGNSVITNGDNRAKLYVDGTAPILREKDILTSDTANSPARRIYLCIQLMYLGQDLSKHKETYFTLINDFLQAAPSALTIVDTINSKILTNSLYPALKEAKALIRYEEELLRDVQPVRSESLPEHG